MNLKDKVAVITGGGGILCSTIAKGLAKEGVKTALLDISEEKAKAVKDEIIGKDGDALAIKCDVLKKEQVEKAKEIVINKYGRCDILINGAGGNHPKGTTTKEIFELTDLGKEDLTTFFDLEQNGFEFVFNLNFLSAFIVSQVFLEEMVKLENSTVINISSMSAFSPMTKVAAYSAAKAAVSNFTAWLAVHFAKVGVRVNAIAPGFFLTEQNKNLLLDKEGNPTERHQKIINNTPMGRLGRPEELIGTIKWLCNEEDSGFVTGTVIPIDGGFLAYSGV
ncbi:SDR family oxidoreductase [Petrotoga halophila]|uniref:D-mannonate oxidoreductase n=1 Tax=Petrotoga halophila DSM 16923 TaxID=1122953 RepID=A0A2S5E9Y8_9BACT|nr:SDR family oxidoreductase [Petrotoga halophila]POZ89990.1 D-mannonate oxidoreductase [Petrotoga halophila DSM 16923]